MVFIGYSNTNDERDAARRTDLVAVGRVRNPRPALGPAAWIVGWVRAAVSRFPLTPTACRLRAMGGPAEGIDPVTVANDLDPVDDEAIPFLLGRNLRRLRTRQGLSLERLARLSGVSRAMLSQIELGRSVPTITLLWKIARALDVSLAALTNSAAQEGVVVLRQSQSKVLLSPDGSVASRALFPLDTDRRVAFHEVLLRPGATDEGESHPPGTIENLVVARGRVDLIVGGTRHRLEERDAILFDADIPHSYANIGDADAFLYLVLSRPDSGL